MPVLLAIDSSTDSLAIALTGPGADALHLFEGAGGAKASEQAVPAALALLRDRGLQLRDLDAIAFGRGPGAFTGLRTACAVAQGLALGSGKPVLALDSLMLVAEDARLQQLQQHPEPEPEPGLTATTTSGGAFDAPLWVAMDARMDEIYAAQYRFDAGTGRWAVLDAPALYAPDALVDRWRSPAAVAGSALRVFPQLQQARFARSWPVEASRARALGSLARQAFAAGPLLDAAEAQPLYVRDKVALTTAERLALGAKA